MSSGPQQPHRQGLVTIKASIDVNRIILQKEDNNKNVSPFPGINQPENLNVVPGEMMTENIQLANENPDPKNLPQCLGSLSGAIPYATDKFPDDDFLQGKEFMNTHKLIGPSTLGRDINKGETEQGINIAIAGIL